MAEEIAFQNGRISNIEGLVTLTLTLTLDLVILHTIVHHSSTSTYLSNFIENEETFLWTDFGLSNYNKWRCESTHAQKDAHLRLALLLVGRLCRRVKLKLDRERRCS